VNRVKVIQESLKEMVYTSGARVSLRLDGELTNGPRERRHKIKASR